MYINFGYLNNSRLDFKDYSAPLIVGSCGTYRLKTRKRLPTYWQKGRRDYQILYVANGKAHFWFDGVEQVVSAGNMVLYKPDEIQKYVYYLEDHPEVFWMSPAQYVLSLRMVNAQSLLEHTNYNVKEISEIVGYDNPLYFSRVFKKEIGQSPAQYRKLRGEPAEE